MSRADQDTPASGLGSPDVYAVVLGIAQDAGVPHAGCRCRLCSAAQDDPTQAEFAASLAIVDGRQWPASVWLIDATPDLARQLYLLADQLGPHAIMPGRIRQPDGLFLTHAHMGHTGGLIYLGPEGMNVRALPVFASPGLVGVLQQTQLWRPLLDNVDLRPLTPDATFELSDQLSITPIPVPHRDELATGTFAYLVRGPRRTLLYLPDIDGWGLWPEARETVGAVDVVLADASFYSAAELGGRPPVAHPLVPDTIAFFADLPGQLILTHLNHTNPLLDRHGDLRAVVRAGGASVAFTGQVIDL